MHPRDLLSTFQAGKIPSVNFRQISLWPEDLLSTCVILPCGWETLCQLLSTFSAATDFLSNFCTTARPFFNFQGNLLQISVKFPCCQITLRQFPFGLETLRQFLSTFCVTGIFSVNFLQLSVLPEYFLTTSMLFPCCQKTFCQENFGQLPSTFRAAGRPSVNFVNFPCGRETFLHLCQHSVSTGEIPTTSVNVLCDQKAFLLLPSPFRVTRRPSVITRRSPVHTKT